MITGHKNVDYIILNKLDDKSLFNFCLSNKEIATICNNDDNFWMNRILIKFPEVDITILRKFKGDRSWSDYYIKDLRKITSSNANEYLIDGAKVGRLDHVIIALKNGADIHADDDFALRLASLNGHLDIVRYLLDNGANIHAYNDEALIWSSLDGRLELVKYLVEKGANIHANNDFAVKWAKEKGHLEIVKYLESLN